MFTPRTFVMQCPMFGCNAPVADNYLGFVDFQLLGSKFSNKLTQAIRVVIKLCVFPWG
jgi:hypothetical protein